MKKIAGQRVVIVLGAHKSGTSTISGLLRILGVDMGADLRQGRGTINPRGFFEDKEFLRLNDDILSAAGGHAWIPVDRGEVKSTLGHFKVRVSDLLISKQSQARAI